MCHQDVFNFNNDRLQRCIIHYTTFEGIVPFYAYHSMGYGDKIRKKHSIPITEWGKKTGQKLKYDVQRDVSQD